MSDGHQRNPKVRCEFHLIVSFHHVSRIVRKAQRLDVGSVWELPVRTVSVEVEFSIEWIVGLRLVDDAVVVEEIVDLPFQQRPTQVTVLRRDRDSTPGPYTVVNRPA